MDWCCMTSFNQELRDRLDKELRNTHFTPSDFHDLAEQYGVRRKYVTCTLRKFCHRGLLEIVKSTPNRTGGEPTKTYIVVEGASFEMRKSGPKNDVVMDMAACCRALENAIDGWLKA